MPTEPVVYDRATRLEAMRRLLGHRPHAAVVAIAENGLFTDLPPSLELDGHALLTGRSGIELIRPNDRKALVDAWFRLLETGLGRTPVTLVTGERAAFNFVDLRDVHGVVLGGVILETGAPSEEQLAQAADLAPRLARVRRNERGVLIELDNALPRMLGRPPGELLGHSSVELIPAEDHPTAIGNWMEMLASPGQAHRWRGRYRRGDGSLLWVETINTNRLADPDHRDVLSEVVDISEEMAALEALRASEQLLRRLTEALPEAVLQVDPRRRIVHANGRLVEMFGLITADTVDEQLAAVLGAEWPRLDAALGGMLAGGHDGDLELQVPVGGEVRVLEFALRGLADRDGAPAGGIVCIADITERDRLRAELEVRATYDALTGCQNRASIMATLERALAGARPGRRGTAVAFVDIDRFKAINDEHGHAAGDELLVLVARRIGAAIRDGDVVGRLGGDEFLVVYPSALGGASLERIGERLRTMVERPATIAGHGVMPRISVGLGWLPAGSLAVDQLVAAADRAMYEAKTPKH